MGSRNTTRLKSAEYTRFQTRDHEGPHHAESHLSVVPSHTFRKSERRKSQEATKFLAILHLSGRGQATDWTFHRSHGPLPQYVPP
jgi:hypothetical protein